MVYIPEFVIGLAIGFVLGVATVICAALWLNEKKKER
jgi:Mg/Co/Ni transporter MgtE